MLYGPFGSVTKTGGEVEAAKLAVTDSKVKVTEEIASEPTSPDTVNVNVGCEAPEFLVLLSAVTVMGLADTVNVSSTEAAAVYVSFPDCVARNTQLPVLKIVTVAPDIEPPGTVQIEVVTLVIDVVRPLDAVADAVAVSPYVLPEMVVHVMV